MFQDLTDVDEYIDPIAELNKLVHAEDAAEQFLTQAKFMVSLLHGGWPSWNIDMVIQGEVVSIDFLILLRQRHGEILEHLQAFFKEVVDSDENEDEYEDEDEYGDENGPVKIIAQRNRLRDLFFDNRRFFHLIESEMPRIMAECHNWTAAMRVLRAKELATHILNLSPFLNDIITAGPNIQLTEIELTTAPKNNDMQHFLVWGKYLKTLGENVKIIEAYLQHLASRLPQFKGHENEECQSVFESFQKSPAIRRAHIIAFQAFLLAYPNQFDFFDSHIKVIQDFSKSWVMFYQQNRAECDSLAHLLSALKSLMVTSLDSQRMANWIDYLETKNSPRSLMMVKNVNAMVQEIRQLFTSPFALDHRRCMYQENAIIGFTKPFFSYTKGTMPKEQISILSNFLVLNIEIAEYFKKNITFLCQATRELDIYQHRQLCTALPQTQRGTMWGRKPKNQLADVPSAQSANREITQTNSC